MNDKDFAITERKKRKIKKELKRIGLWGDWKDCDPDEICFCNRYEDMTLVRAEHGSIDIRSEDFDRLIGVLTAFPSFHGWLDESPAFMADKLWGLILQEVQPGT